MTRDKFERGDGSSINVTIMKEFDAPMVSEQIGSFVRDKRWHRPSTLITLKLTIEDGLWSGR